MKVSLFAPLVLGSVLVACAPSCTLMRPSPAPDVVAFAEVRAVLESNCVHCHGADHFQEMPAITSTKALARLIGPGKWIVPGKPEISPCLQVVSFPEAVWGAMPPTGHMLSKAEVRTLRAWIEAGATMPAANFRFKPRGELPLAR